MIAGVVFLLMSLFYIFSASPMSVLNDWKLDRGHHEATGIVTSVSVTEQVFLRRRSSYQYEYAFEFIPANSSGMMLGHSQTTDERQNAARWRAGDKVPIWYLPDNAAIAQIKGSRLGNAGGLFGGLVLFAIGCGLLWWNVIRPRRRLGWLLANGSVGEFRVTLVEPIRQKGKTVRYRVWCKRMDDETDGGLYYGVLFQPENIMFVHNLEDTGRTVFGLYDPLERERGKERRRLEIPEMWFW